MITIITTPTFIFIFILIIMLYLFLFLKTIFWGQKTKTLEGSKMRFFGELEGETWSE